MSAVSGLRRFISSQKPSLSPVRHLSSRCPQQIARYSSSTQQATARRIKTSHALAAAISASIAAYGLGSLYPPQLATLVSPRPAPPPPDPNLPSSIAYAEELERKLQGLDVLKKLREAPDADDWYETRPYQNIPEERRANSLTAGALHGPGKLTLAPLLRVKKDESECVVITHFGRGLCGHDGIIHGGLIATVFDETLGRLSIMNLPDKVGVTATLTIDYKAPTRADQFVIFRCRLVELNGRKAFVEGTVEDEHGTLLAKARGLFVQPKYAHLLNTKALKQALGEPPLSAAKLSRGDPTPGTDASIPQ